MEPPPGTARVPFDAMAANSLRPPGLLFPAVLLAAVAHSIGWGVRGNWGHEYGAMIAGALSALAVALASLREDWWRRSAYFAFFGALGWSLGGSMAYMVVIAYTHSGSPADIAYGLASLFLIGFLWAAPGGAGSAWAAAVERDRLTEFFTPLGVLFVGWALASGLARLATIDSEAMANYVGPGLTRVVGYFSEESLDWHDTDWLAAWLAIVAMLGLAAWRGRMCRASLLIVQMAIGWWLGFVLLALLPGFNLNPGKSDNWAGMIGLTAALFWYLFRQKQTAVLWAAWTCGLVGGAGFAGVQALKLMAIWALGSSNDHWDSLLERSGYHGWDTNWHSLWEQGFGFVAGLGVALAVGVISTRTSFWTDKNPTRRWTEIYAVAFVLLGITFLNIRKNVASVWLPNGDVPPDLLGIPIQWVFDGMYFVLAATVLWLMVLHRLGRRVALLTDNPEGRGQLLFVVFLWWIVVGNLGRVIPFYPQRFVTEGFIHVNACLVTLLALSLPTRPVRVPGGESQPWRPLLVRSSIWGAALLAVILGMGTLVLWLIAGGKHFGHAGEHYRFQRKAEAPAPAAPGDLQTAPHGPDSP